MEVLGRTWHPQGEIVELPGAGLSHRHSGRPAGGRPFCLAGPGGGPGPGWELRTLSQHRRSGCLCFVSWGLAGGGRRGGPAWWPRARAQLKLDTSPCFPVGICKMVAVTSTKGNDLVSSVSAVSLQTWVGRKKANTLPRGSFSSASQCLPRTTMAQCATPAG